MRGLMALVLGAGVLAALGCSGSTAQPPDAKDDGAQVAALVDRMNDESNTTTRLKESFATGTPIDKKQAQKYPQYRYELKGTATVSGATATATVTIEKHAGGNPTEKEWTFVKEGDKWKIKSAPMP
jgi:hypothetical protein